MGSFGANYGANYDLGVAPTTGVVIQNTHATVQIQSVPTPARRIPVVVYTFHTKGKISKIRRFGAFGRILRDINLTGRLRRFISRDVLASARVVRPFTVLTEAKVFKRVSKAEQEILREATEVKMRKKKAIDDLIERFKEFDDMI